MNRSYIFRSRASAKSSMALLLLLVFSSVPLSSCRTSKELTKSSTSRKNARTNYDPMLLQGEVDSLMEVDQKLLEAVDTLNRRVNTYQERIRNLEDGMEGEPTGSKAGAGGSVTGPVTNRERYAQALRDFNAYDYDVALAEFRGLERDDPNAVFSSNYKYWQGECLYAKSSYNMALQTFGGIVEQYPKSAKAPPAQFMIGECYSRLRIPSSAHEAYERVMNDYPSSEFSARAQDRLRRGIK
jgi:tetratricopeptide (TPR) repeat protein